MKTRSRRRTERTKKCNLEAMPDVIIEKILKDCNYADIQSVRKSCSRLRGIVDLFKPNPKVQSITLQCHPCSMWLAFVDGESARIIYHNHNGGCHVTDRRMDWDPARRRRFFGNTTAASMLRQDFTTLKEALIHQPSPLEEVDIRVGDSNLSIFENNISVLLAELPYLRVASLQIETDHPRHLMAVLPFLSPEALDLLNIRSSSEQPDFLLNLREMSETVQWKSIIQLSISRVAISDPIHVLDIPKSRFPLHAISAEQMTRLKEAFQNSATFEICSIELGGFENLAPALRAIVPDVDDPVDHGLWYFRTSQEGKVLSVVAANNTLMFYIEDVTDVERHHIVRD